MTRKRYQKLMRGAFSKIFKDYKDRTGNSFAGAGRIYRMFDDHFPLSCHGEIGGKDSYYEAWADMRKSVFPEFPER